MDTLINKKLFKPQEFLILNFSFLIILSSCSISKQISKQAKKTILQDSAISKGFIGISIYEPVTNTYWYNYNATKYFTPASNTKLFTLYAGMKFLGDSLVGLRYKTLNDTVYALPAGDPTFLHPDFKNQRVNDFLNAIHLPAKFSNENWKAEKYGNGWSWDDYNDDYMAERNSLPIYGNTMRVELEKNKIVIQHDANMLSSTSIINYIHYYPDNKLAKPLIIRQLNENNFDVYFNNKEISLKTEIPFVTNGISTALRALHRKYPWIDSVTSTFNLQPSTFKTIHSQPSDSLFRPMMHRSDNFFAEQTLLMASNEHLGYMSDENMIDTLLKSDLKDVPQKPKWVDGSGLSRYNLFTPQSFIYILNKLRNEFGWDRIRNILPTGGHGTLTSYYLKDSGYIYAKTGTLSNNCALSGFLLTNSGKLVIFSILANHYQTGATPIRKATERFLEWIRKKY